MDQTNKNQKTYSKKEYDDHADKSFMSGMDQALGWAINQLLGVQPGVKLHPHVQEKCDQIKKLIAELKGSK